MQTERAAYNANKGKIEETVANLQENEFVRLRQLSCRESLRLMDIEDSDVSKMIYDSGNAPDQLYRQAGNSIVVGVLVALFRKMFVDLEEDPGDSYQLFV